MSPAAWRRAFLGLAWLFVACLVVQVYLAGLAVLGSATWSYHTTFVHVFELFPILLFGLAFPARVPKPERWWCLALYALIALQYATAAVQTRVGVPWLAALHPVNALVLVGAAALVAWRVQRANAAT